MRNRFSIPSIADRAYLWGAKHSWRIQQHTSKVVHLHGPSARVKIPIINGAGFDNVYCEREILYPLLAWLTLGWKGTFIDIGANVGQTLLVLLVAGHLDRYIGFEPNSFCCAYLREMIRLNALSQCRALSIGLSDRFQISELHYNDCYDVCASTTLGFRPVTHFKNREHVLLMPGDEVLRRCDLDEVAIIKVDAEGGELEIVRGIQETVGQYKPLLLLEVLPHLHLENDRTIFPNITDEERRHIVAERRGRTEALESILRELGYGWYRIETNGDLTPTSCMRADGPEQRTEMNFLAVHDSRVADLEECASGRLRRPRMA